MTLLIFNLRGSHKYTEVRKCAQNSGRLTTWFPKVGHFNDIASLSKGSGGKGVTHCEMDIGRSPFSRAELWFSAEVDWALAVWGLRPSGKRSTPGWKLCCEDRTPTASLGPRPSRDIPTSLPDVRDTDCQSKNPPQCPKGTTAQSVCMAPVSHSQQGCLSLLGAHLLPRERENLSIK